MEQPRTPHGSRELTYPGPEVLRGAGGAAGRERSPVVRAPRVRALTARAMRLGTGRSWLTRGHTHHTSAAIYQCVSTSYTVDSDFIDKSDLRVTAPAFEAELLRDEGRVVGRLDARFTGPAGDLLGARPSHDPQSTAISSAYTSAFNSYLRGELGYDGDREYVPSGGTRDWNWGRLSGGGAFVRGGGTPNVAVDLATAMKRNPALEVLLINGIYDLATPYFAAVWTMDRMGLPPELRDNIERADFAAGHMMYVEQALLPQWKEVLDAFILRTSGGSTPVSQ